PFLAAAVLSHHPRFFGRGLKWFLRSQGISLKTTGAGTPDSTFVEYIFLRHADYGTGSADQDNEWTDARPDTRAFKETFRPGPKYMLLDQSTVQLYERTPHPTFNVSASPDAIARRLEHTFRRWVKGPLHVRVKSSPQGLRDGHLGEIAAACEG